MTLGQHSVPTTIGILVFKNFFNNYSGGVQTFIVSESFIIRAKVNKFLNTRIPMVVGTEC
jgi:hypothetical protein